MKAVVVHGAGDLRVEELPDPEPAAGEVVVAMEWGGICGSDLAYWRHGRSGTAVLRHPMVLGHEMAGTIASLGSGVAHLQVGQAVTFQPAQLVGDGKMPARLAGRTNLYSSVRYFGSAAFDPHTNGGFSELRAVRAEQIRPLPSGVSTRLGAVAEPLAVAMHAVGRAGDVSGKRVLVNGCGPIGSLVVAALKFAGADYVIAADVASHPLCVAEEMGADRTVNLATASLPDDVDLVFEASGAPGAISAVLHAVAKGGTVVQVGNLPGTPVTTVLGDLVSREVTWIGSYRFADEIDLAVAALGAGLNVNPLITHEFEIEDAELAMDTAAGPESSKVLLRLSNATDQTGVVRPSSAERTARRD
ncbi:L-idonate 5-dehydrogenase [Propionicimonas sp.]|uniref:L-idonate 5-dehydrogenase n=1 Tax=Propionicimonas sp. TaxID=1955623 RepID=UPI0017AA296F|nr:L-idonate 5-dehydrogenase [Propionicimonas sp.]MBU3976325.1 L-idonate 5-dehydrogenase [Actinomycetota bacterium]MBA3022082.1 L-idonate 5-dehydrogenase [Propionicimonas sp.]MBU3987482.1 L-idonate 5-dehydrogenase [Actinomycetota bacterium]MBU4006573.1 L-idonate 5-dehydrogenase [Actinomycetota bacterium]MBU4065178.1 L-idonate 5-dehydrogenase [Actinomycetota bacterium]